MEELSGWVEEVVNSISSFFLSPLKTCKKKCIKTLERVKSQKVLSFFLLLLVSSFWHYQKDMVGGIEWPWGAQCLRPPKNSQVSFLHKDYKRRRSLCLAGFLDSPAAKAPKIKLCLRPSLLCYIIDDRRHWFSRLSEHTSTRFLFYFFLNTHTKTPVIPVFLRLAVAILSGETVFHPVGIVSLINFFYFFDCL